MRIEIEIPKEFEEHFKQDKFEDTLHRLSADAHLIAGNYEQETAIMLIKAFKESKVAFDKEAVVAELESELCHEAEIGKGYCHGFCSDCAVKKAIEIVRGKER